MPPLSNFTYGKRKLIQINSTVEQKLAKVLCLAELNANLHFQLAFYVV